MPFFKANDRYELHHLYMPLRFLQSYETRNLVIDCVRPCEAKFMSTRTPKLPVI